MAYSYNVYTGNGSTTQFTIGFSYIRREHVKVYVAYVDTAYTYVNNTTVQLATAPGAGVRVEVRRVTPATSPLVDFADGSTLVAADLDTSNLQHLYLEQELDDANKQAIFVDPATGLLTAANQRITNVADPVNAQDVSTKAYTDAQIDSALINDVIAGTGLTISDNTPTAGQITVGITNSGVGVTQIADGAVTSAKIADATIITGDLADGAVTSAKIADGTIVAGDLASDSVTTAKILNANVTTAKIADLNVTTGKIADLGVTTGKIADAAITAAKIAGGSIDSTKLDGATVVTNSEVAGVSPNDTSFFTTSASDLRYFRQDSSETISSGQTWSASDSYVATTAAIDARVIDLVDDVGGFVPIANENSFPVANPDINNPDGTGTIVSIAVMSTSRTPSSGTVTIANGSGSNTVTITGCGSTVLAAGFGVLVETTSTLHTYTFHRLTPKATEVTTVASISTDVTTVAGNNANVTAVAGNAANITTVAGSIANVNAVGGSIANVNSVASNLASVNSFANTYRIAASDPATSLDVGDLVFNTTASELRVYNGSVWQGGVTATGNLVSRAGDTMTGALAHPLGAAATPSITFTGDTNTGIYSPGADQVAISTGGSGRLFVNASGTVGIGATPISSYPLNIINNGNNFIQFAKTGDALVGSLIGRPSGTADLRLQNSENEPIVFLTNNTERLRITAAGLVGVGTSSPSNTLHVAGTGSTQAAFERTGSNGVFIGLKDGSGNLAYLGNTNGVFSIQTPGSSYSDKLVVTSPGLVGIGTSAPSSLLHLKGANPQLIVDTPDASTEPRLRLYKNGSPVGQIAGSSGVTQILTEGAFQVMTNGGTNAVYVDTSQRVGIGTTNPNAPLSVNGAICSLLQGSPSTLAYRIDAGGFGQPLLIGHYYDTEDHTLIKVVSGGAGTTASFDISNQGIFKFTAAGSAERARIDGSGRLLVGTSTARSNFFNTSTVSGLLQIEGTTDLTRVFSQTHNTADNTSSIHVFAKSRGTTVGSNTIVQSQDSLGEISFQGSDGTEFVAAAKIEAVVDGTPGANDMPGRLVFSTTPDSASSPVERFRIASDGSFSSVIPGGSTLYPQFGCRAWVNFNGTTATPSTIRGSGNVSSVTKSSTGLYVVNLTTALADVNYAVTFSSDDWGGAVSTVTSRTTSGFRISTFNTTSGSNRDDAGVQVAVFR